MQGLPEPDLVEDDPAILSEINVTPLTDVFLVLLIIFMVGASTAVDLERRNAALTKGRLHERALQVTTPEGAGDQALIPKDIVVSILPDGTLFVNAEQVPYDALRDRLRAEKESSLSARVVVRGDEAASYRLIMDAINAARSVGLKDVALSTRTGGSR
ncbi:MAG: biopolymer transporter ExbD [Deltaproteobacteria bacterium]|nr:biopolymer transporter ExbD [Deltaproteobacteria bacterium]